MGQTFRKSHQECKTNGGDNKQIQGSSCGLLNTNTFQDPLWAEERNPDWITLIDKWKCGVCGIKTWRRPTQTPCANNDIGGLYGADGLLICATTQPWQLSTNDDNRTRLYAWNRTVPTKPSTFQMMYRRGWITIKEDCNGGTTALPVLTGGPVDGF